MTDIFRRHKALLMMIFSISSAFGALILSDHLNDQQLELLRAQRSIYVPAPNAQGINAVIIRSDSTESEPYVSIEFNPNIDTLEYLPNNNITSYQFQRVGDSLIVTAHDIQPGEIHDRAPNPGKTALQIPGDISKIEFFDVEAGIEFDKKHYTTPLTLLACNSTVDIMSGILSDLALANANKPTGVSGCEANFKIAYFVTISRLKANLNAGGLYIAEEATENIANSTLHLTGPIRLEANLSLMNKTTEKDPGK